MKYLLTLCCMLLCINSFAQQAPRSIAKAALVVDMDTDEVLFEKNEESVRSIASITKLMTAMVTIDAGLPLDERIRITWEDAKAARPNGGAVPVGGRFTRAELIRLALMSSENRAAAALARTYPGGIEEFVTMMNVKAQEIGMYHTTFTDPTGLFNTNVSTVQDLAILAKTAMSYELIQEYSTTISYKPALNRSKRTFSTTNRLVRKADWEVLLQKTGYITDAGRCVVMVANVASRRVIMVLLGTPSNKARAVDATRLRDWVERSTLTSAALLR